METYPDPTARIFIDNLAFYARPWWKGLLWLACFLGGDFLIMNLWGDFTRLAPAEAMTLLRIPTMLINPFGWVAALIVWRTRHKIGWSSPNAGEPGRGGVIQYLLANALGLFGLIAVALSFKGMWTMLYINAQIGSNNGWPIFISVILMDSLTHAYVLSLAAPLFMVLTIRLIPRERGRLTAIILPAMLANLCNEAASYAAWHAMIRLTAQYQTSLFGQYDLLLLPIVFWTPVAFALLWLAIRLTRGGSAAALLPSNNAEGD